jgi:multidrug efflux pump
VQKADILGGRTFRDAHLAEARPARGVQHQPERSPLALAANNFLSAVGHTKGSLVQVNLTANTDLRSVEEFKNLVVRRSPATSWCG